MAAPAFQSSGTTLTGTAATPATVAVPSGVQAGDIIWLSVYIENTSTVACSGFTAVTNAPISCTGAGAHSVWNFWKRSTGSEPGSYSVTYTGSVYREAVAQRISGCVASGDPTEINNGAQRSSSGTATPAVSGTTTGPDRLLIWSGSNFTGTGTWTPPTSPGTWTMRGIGGGLGTATAPFLTAGATGNVIGNQSNAGFETGFLIALLPAVTQPAPTVFGQYNSFH